MKQFFAKVTLAAMVIFTLLSSASAQNPVTSPFLFQQEQLSVFPASVIQQ